MNFLENIIPENLASAFGWMIIHSLWEGALVALLLSIVLLMLNKKSARVRYLVSVGALLFFAAISIRTFAEHYNSANTNEMQAQQVEKVNQAASTNNSITNNETTDQTVTNKGFFQKVSDVYSNYFYQHIPLIVTIYLLGVLLLTLKLMGGYLYTQRLKHYRTTNLDSKYKLLSKKISKKLNIKQKVGLLESALVSVPVTLGHLKPVILFPIGTLTGLSYSQVEAIIAHELAHIKRADYLVNFLQSVLEILFFYHPAIWWISSIVREERENVCDDIALEVSEQPAELARALVYVGQFETNQTSLAMSAIGNKNKLIRRVKRMMGENKQKTVRSRVYAASLMLILMMAFGAIACSTTNGETYHQSRKGNLVYEEDRHGDHRYINTDRLEDDERSYVFYKRYHGDKIRWDVTIDDSKIVSLYRDDEKVPVDEYYKYEDMILDEVEDIDWELEVLEEDLADLKDDLKDIKINIDDDFVENLASLKDELKDIKINIDDDFAEEMRDLAHNFKVEFDNDEFEREMDELREELKDINVCVNFDSDEFSREMKNLSRELASIKVDVDLSGLDESMRELKEELKDLDIDMSELKKEMKILGDFLDELKDEMIDDGLIDSERDLRRVEFEDDEMYINNRKVPHDLYLKYREIYKKYYDEYPDHNSFRYHDDDRW